MRGPCVSLLSAAHRGRPPLTPWYTGTQQLGPLGGAGRWHQQRRLFPALHNAHTLFFLLPWRCEWAEKVCLSRWMKKRTSNCATISFRSGWFLNEHFDSQVLSLPFYSYAPHWQQSLTNQDLKSSDFFVFQITFHRRRRWVATEMKRLE